MFSFSTEVEVLTTQLLMIYKLKCEVINNKLLE